LKNRENIGNACLLVYPEYNKSSENNTLNPYENSNIGKGRQGALVTRDPRCRPLRRGIHIMKKIALCFLLNALTLAAVRAYIAFEPSLHAGLRASTVGFLIPAGGPAAIVVPLLSAVFSILTLAVSRGAKRPQWFFLASASGRGQGAFLSDFILRAPWGAPLWPGYLENARPMFLACNVAIVCSGFLMSFCFSILQGSRKRGYRRF
jgi:hypothetical protein